jgi:electron transport protein HydN
MNNLVIAESGRCIACRTCEVACVLAHSPANALEMLSPRRFVPRLKLILTSRVSAPVQCHQCEDAPCVKVCPNRAIVQRQNSIQVLEGRCVGCKSCLLACPYGAVELVAREAIVFENLSANQQVAPGQVEVFKCDLCLHRQDGPACVAVCPTKAIHLMDAKTLAERLQHKREQAAVAMA